MSHFSKVFRLVLLSFLVFGCDDGRLGADRWAQFHADGPSQGFTGVHSTYALQPKWTADVGRVTHSSPSIGEDGTLYVGTVDGKLIAVDSDSGEIKWSWMSPKPDSMILSSPAVGEDGNIYIVINRKLLNNFHSMLASITPDGELRWLVSFPILEGMTSGFTTASAKTWGSAQELYIFVPGNLTTTCESLDFRGDPDCGLDELLVYDQSGNLINRKVIGGCPRARGSGGPGFLGGIWDFLADVFSGGTAVIGDAVDPLYETFGWLNTTVAIVDFPNLSNVTYEHPLVTAVGYCYGLRLTGFQWDPPNLTRLWSYEDDSNEYSYSSPAVFPSGLLVLGRKDGLVQGFNVADGSKLWGYDAKEAVMATPASFGRQIYVASLKHLHVLEPNGEVVDIPPALTKLEGQTIASPALTADLAYISTNKGFHTRSFDLRSRSIDRNAIGGLSSPAVGEDGTIYVVTLEEGTGILRAYPAP
jgi:outer membrane protein assembly factor BamB